MMFFRLECKLDYQKSDRRNTQNDWGLLLAARLREKMKILLDQLRLNIR